MIDFIDKTSEQNGTPINRENLMALQGFQAQTTTFNKDGSITQTNGYGHTLTTWIDDGSIMQVFKGEKTITKKITKQVNTITEVIL